jgi:hypothetical protein
MTFPTYEQYDEYFINFLKIYPYLTYANNSYDKKKIRSTIKFIE